MSRPSILVSWVSYNHDPFEREKNGRYRQTGGQPIPGPALELLFNEASPYEGRIDKAYFLCRRSSVPEKGLREIDPLESQVLAALSEELRQRRPSLQVECRYWDTSAPPTAHREIFLFTAEQLRAIRKEHPTARLVINLSSGSPQMQMALLLALQARLAGQPVEAIQGIPRDKRQGRDILELVPWNLLGDLNRLGMVGPVGQLPRRWSLAEARSAPFKRLATEVEHVGNVPFPVLILGRRGTGKTHVATLLRAKHLEYLGRAVPEGPWEFRLNCALFRGELLQSELFGHEKGSFTGAQKQHIGILERAKDDCVFLDEIHHLEPESQARLLLALERGGRFRRLGGTASITSAFRLIAASNRTRRELREERLFDDFYDRVSDFVLEVPDLRECRDDLPAIWDQVVAEACEDVVRLRGGDQQVNAEQLAAEFSPHRNVLARGLMGLQLPGNWRDLQRLARRLLAAGLALSNYATFVLKEEDVERELTLLRDEERAGAAGELKDALPSMERCRETMREAQQAGSAVPFDELTDEWVWRHLQAAVDVAGSGNKAAQLLGLSPSTLNTRMRQLNTKRKKDGGPNSPP
jgi:DNA-binding NtrC family response regulator